MTDQTIGLRTIKGRSARLRAFAADLLGRIELRPRSAWTIAALIIAALGRHFWIDEGYLPNILFTAAVNRMLGKAPSSNQKWRASRAAISAAIAQAVVG